MLPGSAGGDWGLDGPRPDFKRFRKLVDPWADAALRLFRLKTRPAFIPTNPEPENSTLLRVPMCKICLVILFNHRFERNLTVLDRIYGPRFDHIRHLMPFATVQDPRVIPVFDNSHRFQNFFPQSLSRLLEVDASHFVVVGDDLILNPDIHQGNLLQLLDIHEDEGYIKNFRTLHDLNYFWGHALNAYFTFEQTPGLEWKSLLPSIDDARRRLEAHGVRLGDMVVSQETKRLIIETARERGSNYIDRYALRDNSAPLAYPMVAGYSDFFVVPRSALHEFAHICGAFAGMNLFAEIAIPTALLMSTRRVKFEQDRLKGLEIWGGREQREFGSNFGFSIRNLFQTHEDKLYVHPVKLSRWQWDLPLP